MTLFGTAVGVWVTGIDFSLTCFLGIVSLMGILVRNAIIMFDYAEELRTTEHLTAHEAIFKYADPGAMPRRGHQPQYEEQEAREQLADKQQLLSIKVQKSWDDVTVAYRKTLIARRSIEQSRENLRLNEQFYHAGTGKMTELLDAQQQVQQSRDNWVEAVATYRLRLAEYEEMTK